MFKSAINRMGYFKRMLLSFIVAYIILKTLPSSGGVGEFSIYHWLFVLIIVATWVLMCKFTAQRLRDMGRSPWLSLLMIVPTVNLCIGIWCLIAKTKGVATPLAAQPA